MKNFFPSLLSLLKPVTIHKRYRYRHTGTEKKTTSVHGAGTPSMLPQRPTELWQ